MVDNARASRATIGVLGRSFARARSLQELPLRIATAIFTAFKKVLRDSDFLQRPCNLATTARGALAP